MTEEQAYNLIQRHLSGETSPAEDRQLYAWLDAAPANRRLFDEAEKLWRRIDAPQPANVPPFEAFWDELQGKLADADTAEPVRVMPLERAPGKTLWGRFSDNRWLAAAALFLVLIGGTLVYRMVFSPGTMRVYTTRNAERQRIDLPDGSHAELNAASEIRFDAAGFDTARVIALAGQAFFKVTSNGQPFVVRTDNAEIRVLGTRFDVRARDEKTQVKVQSGKVSLQGLSAAADTSVVLTAGQMSFVDRQAPPVLPVAIDTLLIGVWRQQKLVFDNMPLAEITSELERVYDVEIKIAAPALHELAITGTFEQQPVTDILASLCLTLNLKYTELDGKFIISR